MPLGVGSALWAYVAPLAETNMALNPSFEQGTSGVVAIQTATLGSTSQFQRYGAWSAKVTPSSNGTSGALLGTFTTGNGTTYSVSCWAFVEQGVPMRFGVGDNNGLNLTSGTVTFTGGGTWHWYTCAITEAAQGTRGVVLQKTSGNSQLSFYADGLKISPWSDALERTTTYFDGDTGGGTWQSTPHASISTRPAQYRAGGSIIALADIGLSVDQFPGAGVSPIEVSTQSYAVVDGAQFQRQRAAARQFTLTASPVYGTSLGDFHITRRTLWDAFKPDAVTPQQPVRFLYVGGQGTQQIDAYYQGGLELGNMDGPIAEQVAVQFVAPDPYWYNPTQQGTTLAPRVALGSVNYIARRSPLGKWGTIGSNGTTVYGGASPVVLALAMNPAGTLFVGGEFSTVAGTAYRAAAQYFPSTNTFGTLAGGTLGATQAIVRSFAQSPAGTLFVGGQFDRASGTTLVGICQWNGAFGSLAGGTLNVANSDNVFSLLYHPNGSLFVGGSITGINGTTARHLVFWNGVTSGTPAGGVLNQLVNEVTRGLDNRVFVAGNFTTAGGTTSPRITQWNGAWGSLSGGSLNAAPVTLAVGQDGKLNLGGAFTTLDTAALTRTASWNGVQYTQMGQGLDGDVYTMFVDTDNSIWAGGNFQNTGGIPLTGGIARFNGASWLSSDIDLTTQNGTVYSILRTGDGWTYIGGDISGTAYCASVGTIVNTGRAQSYPTLRLYNRSSTAARLYQLLNVTTGDGIYFNLSLLPSEMATLDLTPGNRSFTSNFRNNIFGAILPGSNLATWSLLPGTSYISFFSDNDSLEAAIFWQNRGWSIDSGTIS